MRKNLAFTFGVIILLGMIIDISVWLTGHVPTWPAVFAMDIATIGAAIWVYTLEVRLVDKPEKIKTPLSYTTEGKVLEAGLRALARHVGLIGEAKMDKAMLDAYKDIRK